MNKQPVIYINGVDSLLKKLKNLNTENVAKNSITRSFLQLEKKVKVNLSGKLVKVKTGRLRRSFVTKVTNGPNLIEWELGSNVKYAQPVENRKFYFKSALRGFKNQMLANLSESLGKKIKWEIEEIKL